MKPRPLILSVSLVLLLACSSSNAAQFGAAADVEVVVGRGSAAAAHNTNAGAQQPHQPPLNTGFMSVSSPKLDVAGPGRPGTTRVKLQLQQPHASSFMPVVTATANGVVHNVVNTWTFLQHYARQSQLVRAFNEQQAGSNDAAMRYPHAADAIRAASALLPLNSMAAGGVAVSRHLLSDTNDNKNLDMSTHTAPTNALLLLDGSAIGAVADIMSVDAVDTPASTIAVTLDVVHNPGAAVSEFEVHSPQTLDEHAHYHFFTPAGVAVDAARFLALVKQSAGGAVPGLHIFTKSSVGVVKTFCSSDSDCGWLDNPAVCEVGVCGGIFQKEDASTKTFFCGSTPNPNQVVCREKQECLKAAYCNGVDAGCPHSQPDDGAPCTSANCNAGESKVCSGGTCVCGKQPPPECSTNTDCTNKDCSAGGSPICSSAGKCVCCNGNMDCASLTDDATCSVGVCQSGTCTVVPSANTVECKPTGDCLAAAMCDGTKTGCPPPSPMADGTTCSNANCSTGGSPICIGGKCVCCDEDADCASLTDDATCSVGVCKSGTCAVMPSANTVECKPTGDCLAAAMCDGTKTGCPPPSPMADGDNCTSATGCDAGDSQVCSQGACICESPPPECTANPDCSALNDDTMCSVGACGEGTCRVIPCADTVVCAPEGECVAETTCSGQSTGCPAPTAKPDGTACTSATGCNAGDAKVCSGGACVCSQQPPQDPPEGLPPPPCDEGMDCSLPGDTAVCIKRTCTNGECVPSNADSGVCRAETACKEAAVCNGAPGCPASLDKPDDAACSDANCAAGACSGGECMCVPQGFVPPLNPVQPVTPPEEVDILPGARCTPGRVCRAAKGFCDVPEVCPGSGICPPDTTKDDGVQCPWSPGGHSKYYGRGYSAVGVSADKRPTKVSEREAIARLSSAPSHYKKDGWPPCEGTCILGQCALLWDHPACCRVGGYGYGHPYAASEGQGGKQGGGGSMQARTADTLNGHWEGDYFCWGYEA